MYSYLTIKLQFSCRNVQRATALIHLLFLTSTTWWQTSQQASYFDASGTFHFSPIKDHSLNNCVKIRPIVQRIYSHQIHIEICIQLYSVALIYFPICHLPIKFKGN